MNTVVVVLKLVFCSEFFDSGLVDLLGVHSLLEAKGEAGLTVVGVGGQ